MTEEWLHYTNSIPKDYQHTSSSMKSRRRIHSKVYERQGIDPWVSDYRNTSMIEMSEDSIGDDLGKTLQLLQEARNRIVTLKSEYSARLLQLEEKEIHLEQRERELDAKETFLNQRERELGQGACEKQQVEQDQPLLYNSEDDIILWDDL